MKIHITEKQLLAKAPCQEGLKFAAKRDFNFPRIYDDCPSEEWLFWLAERFFPLPVQVSVRLAEGYYNRASASADSLNRYEKHTVYADEFARAVGAAGSAFESVREASRIAAADAFLADAPYRLAIASRRDNVTRAAFHSIEAADAAASASHEYYTVVHKPTLDEIDRMTLWGEAVDARITAKRAAADFFRSIVANPFK